MDFREARTFTEADAFFNTLFSLGCFVSGSLVLASLNLAPASINMVGSNFTHYLWASTLALGGVLSLVGRFFGYTRLKAVGSLGISLGFFVYVTAILSTGRMGSLIAGIFFLCISVAYAYRAYALNRLHQYRRVQHERASGFGTID